MAYDVTPGWPISTSLSPHKAWCRRIISTSPIQLMRPTAAFRLTPENAGRNSSRLRLIQASEAGAAKNARFLPFPTTLHQPNHPNLRRHRQRSTVKMSWFGVTPLKKFPAPVCTSIGLLSDSAAAVDRQSTDNDRSAPHGSLPGCRYARPPLRLSNFCVEILRAMNREPRACRLTDYPSRGHCLRRQLVPGCPDEQYVPVDLPSPINTTLPYPTGAEFKNDPRNPNLKSGH